MTSMYLGGSSSSHYSHGPKSFYYRMPARAVEYDQFDDVVARTAGKLNSGRYEAAVALWTSELEPLIASIREMAQPDDPHLRAAETEYVNITKRLQAAGPPVPIGKGGMRHMGVVMSQIDPETLGRSPSPQKHGGAQWDLKGGLVADPPRPPTMAALRDKPDVLGHLARRPSRRQSAASRGPIIPMTLAGEVNSSTAANRNEYTAGSPLAKLPWPEEETEQADRTIPESRLNYVAPHAKQISLAEQYRQRKESQEGSAEHHTRHTESPLQHGASVQNSRTPSRAHGRYTPVVNGGILGQGHDAPAQTTYAASSRLPRPSLRDISQGGSTWYPNNTRLAPAQDYQDRAPAGLTTVQPPAAARGDSPQNSYHPTAHRGYEPSPITHDVPGKDRDRSNSSHSSWGASGAAPRWSRASSLEQSPQYPPPGGNQNNPYRPSRDAHAERRKMAMRSHLAQESDILNHEAQRTSMDHHNGAQPRNGPPGDRPSFGRRSVGSDSGGRTDPPSQAAPPRRSSQNSPPPSSFPGKQQNPTSPTPYIPSTLIISSPSQRPRDSVTGIGGTRGSPKTESPGSVPPWLNLRDEPVDNSPNKTPVFPSSTTHDIQATENMAPPRSGKRLVAGMSSVRTTGLGLSHPQSPVRGKRVYPNQRSTSGLIS